MSGLETGRTARFAEVMGRHVAQGNVGGVAWWASVNGESVVGSAGTLTRGEPAPVERNTIFRIASMTKPISAAAALLLVEECLLRLEDPVDGLLPELADRRVLVDPLGPVDGDTVATRRPITVHDVLTNELGLGMDFAAPWPQPLIEAMGALGLGSGPPEPQTPPGPDEWIRRLGTLPLMRQPGERWLYNVGSDVLGVLIARAADQPLEAFLAERIFAPLGMSDSGFSTASTGRLGTTYAVDPETGERSVYDAPDGQWSSPPAFPSAADGLVSTVDDFAAFATMLLDCGRLPDGSQLLSAASVAAMTTDQLGAGIDRSSVAPSGALGWGYGVGVQIRTAGVGRGVGSYGWDGGLGSSWVNDPQAAVAGVIMTTDMFTGPAPAPAVIRDFWTTLYTSLTD